MRVQEVSLIDRLAHSTAVEYAVRMESKRAMELVHGMNEKCLGKRQS